MDMEDDVLGAEAMAMVKAEVAKKMAERVADMKEMKGARATPVPPSTEAMDIANNEDSLKRRGPGE